jgi:hypothetical protein
MIITLNDEQLRDLAAGHMAFVEEKLTHIHSPEGVPIAEVVNAVIQNGRDSENRVILLSIRRIQK